MKRLNESLTLVAMFILLSSATQAMANGFADLEQPKPSKSSPTAPVEIERFLPPDDGGEVQCEISTLEVGSNAWFRGQTRRRVVPIRITHTGGGVCDLTFQLYRYGAFIQNIDVQLSNSGSSYILWYAPGEIVGDGHNVELRDSSGRILKTSNRFYIPPIGLNPNAEFVNSTSWSLQNIGARTDEESNGSIRNGRLYSGDMSDNDMFIATSDLFTLLKGDYDLVLPSNFTGAKVDVIGEDGTVILTLSKGNAYKERRSNEYFRPIDAFSRNSPASLKFRLRLTVYGGAFADTPEEANGLSLDYLRVQRG